MNIVGYINYHLKWWKTRSETDDLRSHLLVHHVARRYIWLPVFVVDKSTAQWNIIPETSSNISLKIKRVWQCFKKKLHQINLNVVLAKQQWICKHIWAVLQIWKWKNLELFQYIKSLTVSLKKPASNQFNK